MSVCYCDNMQELKDICKKFRNENPYLSGKQLEEIEQAYFVAVEEAEETGIENACELLGEDLEEIKECY